MRIWKRGEEHSSGVEVSRRLGLRLAFTRLELVLRSRNVSVSEVALFLACRRADRSISDRSIEDARLPQDPGNPRESRRTLRCWYELHARADLPRVLPVRHGCYPRVAGQLLSVDLVHALGVVGRVIVICE